MRSRGLVVALALLLAIGATAAVFLYVNGVKENAITSGGATQVVVATENISANTPLDPLIESGFKTITVASDNVVVGAVTQTSELQGRIATAPILANEQIPQERLSGGSAVQGGALGTCETCVAITVRVDGPPGGGGNVQAGDNVTLYATFEGLKVFSGVRDLLASLQTKPGAGAGQQPTAPPTQTAELPSFTMTVEPTIKVLKVENPEVTGTNENNTSNGSVTVTLDVPKEDAEFVTYTFEKGSLYFGLLPPGQQGLQLPAQSISLDRFLGKKQA